MPRSVAERRRRERPPPPSPPPLRPPAALARRSRRCVRAYSHARASRLDARRSAARRACARLRCRPIVRARFLARRGRPYGYRAWRGVVRASRDVRDARLSCVLWTDMRASCGWLGVLVRVCMAGGVGWGIGSSRRRTSIWTRTRTAIAAHAARGNIGAAPCKVTLSCVCDCDLCVAARSSTSTSSILGTE